jgi:hypothetical protein
LSEAFTLRLRASSAFFRCAEVRIIGLPFPRSRGRGSRTA